jgi:hypothetical protein
MSPHKPEPDWRELMMGQVDAHLARRYPGKPPYRDFRARIPLVAAPALAQAAAARQMSVSAYLRRAGLAFAAFDLGLKVDDLLVDEPITRISRFAGVRADFDPTGIPFGKWKIEGLG